MLATIDWDTASDETLLDAFRAGDDRAYALLFGRHRRFAAAAARRYVAHADVDDVVSEAFTSMLQQIRRGAGPCANVRAYLATCVRHEALRRARQHARTRTTDDLHVLDQPVSFDHARTDLGERQHIAAAMGLLSARHREVLWSVEVDGYLPRDLAASLGLTSNTVSALAYRARQAFSKAYELTE